MRFAARLDRATFTATVDRKLTTIRQAAGALTLYEPVGWSGPRRIGSWSWTNDRLTTGALRFGAGPWLEVITTTGPVAEVVTEQRMAAALETRDPREVDIPVLDPPGDLIVEVDGEARRFDLWPDGVGWQAASPPIVISANGFAPAGIRLVRVTQIEPYLAETRAALLAQYDAA
ncbi:hypothetical protein AMIS_59410 [Actinoplanes missouriensis 431]|uniref:Uncharacterized protein n=1 Tax=Actinoplanes missouriensis (strain ATCC 14538 / DSM 43046 / CBS 188.64 / JCM 3121 / NBRC 102363 / NCIMB 12654 / NRRL B-3342 / UNCC 431) TaxID=512565 RepID=I0HDS4_ACTM4|nr:hypothetical protein [Actinoplanes missouriensis]BAL91161.1 hypothetical protein AMIS_59410 [Actinoplanes missouriensis 431]